MRESLRHGLLCRVWLSVLWLFTPCFLDAQSISQRIELVRESVLEGNTEDFPTVNGGRVSSRGDIAITLRQDFQVRVYDSTGRRVAIIGRRGRAPGEFELPQAQGWFADTIWIYDATLRRHSYFTRQGKLVRTAPLETAQHAVLLTNDSSGARLVDFLPHARLLDGGLVGTGSIIRTSAGNVKVREQVLVRYNLGGTATKITEFELDSRWDPALAIPNALAVSPDGTQAVLTAVSDLTTTGSVVIVTRVSQTGAVLNTTRIPYRGIAYPKARRDSILRRGIGVDRDQSVPASRAPSVLSPVYGALLRADGMAFVTIRRDIDSWRAVLVDRQGVERGQLDLPPNTQLLMVAGQKLWLRERDEDGVNSVVRYRMRCTRGPCP